MTFTHLAPSQNALTLIMNVRKPLDEHVKAIKELLQDKTWNETAVAGLNKVGTVHFARFLLFNNDTQFATITTFDGDFESYVRDFVALLYPILNPFFVHIEDTDEALPLQKNPDKFLEFAQRTIAPSLFWYSAYPTASTLEIRDHFGVGDQ
jgi:hypothetical protein